jgi:hypothetical protein
MFSHHSGFKRKFSRKDGVGQLDVAFRGRRRQRGQQHHGRNKKRLAANFHPRPLILGLQPRPIAHYYGKFNFLTFDT